jgi:hypothetical protein
MLSEFVPFEIVLEIGWRKALPIDHGRVKTQALVHVQSSELVELEKISRARGNWERCVFGDSALHDCI